MALSGVPGRHSETRAQLVVRHRVAHRRTDAKACTHVSRKTQGSQPSDGGRQARTGGLGKREREVGKEGGGGKPRKRCRSDSKDESFLLAGSVPRRGQRRCRRPCKVISSRHQQERAGDDDTSKKTPSTSLAVTRAPKGKVPSLSITHLDDTRPRTEMSPRGPL